MNVGRKYSTRRLGDSFGPVPRTAGDLQYIESSERSLIQLFELRVPSIDTLLAIAGGRVIFRGAGRIVAGNAGNALLQGFHVIPFLYVPFAGICDPVELLGEPSSRKH